MWFPLNALVLKGGVSTELVCLLHDIECSAVRFDVRVGEAEW